MNSGNIFLDNLFDGLSSIYRKDNGMLSSTLFTVLNAQAESFQDVQRKLDQIQANTYIDTADADALEANFGILIDFPKPPRLNTLDNGDDIYRAMLKSLYHIFQSGSTNSSMEEALNVTASYLTVDPNTDDTIVEVNYATLLEVDNTLEIAYRAVSTDISGNIVGEASPSDITFAPQDLFVTAYDDDNKIISFTGTVDTGTNYQIRYERDIRDYRGTNWINLTDTDATNVRPLLLSSGSVNTFNNIEFSYWWNEYNDDGDGVLIDEFKIDRTDSSLAWRLPEKTIQFVAPFSDNEVTKTIEFYNLSGTAFDVTKITDTNPDVLFTDVPINYYTDVSPTFTDYHIRYSQNNQGIHTALDKFEGALPKFTKRFKSIEFDSDNFGALDFFETGNSFSLNNPMGEGTKNIWLNVENVDGKYILNNENVFNREFSLYQDILFEENFENGNVARFSTNDPSGMVITDLVGVPFKDKENNLTLMASGSGVEISASPVLGANTLLYGNNVQIDFFDALNSGTQTLIDITRTGTETDEYHRFRLGIDNDVVEYQFSESDVFLNAKNFGFAATYFPDSGSTNRAVNVRNFNNTVDDQYVLVSGNPNENFSLTSMKPTGVSNTLSITPNVEPDILSNADSFRFQFTNNDNAFMQIIFDGLIDGTGTGFVGLQGRERIRLQAKSTDTFWKWRHSISTEPSNGIKNKGGTTTIPIMTGLNTWELKAGEHPKVNGVIYTGTSDLSNPSTLFGRLGSVTNSWPFTSTQTENSQDSIYMRTRPEATFHFYEVGNDALIQNYRNTLYDQALANNIPVPYYYQVFRSETQTQSPKIYLESISASFIGTRSVLCPIHTTYELAAI